MRTERIIAFLAVLFVPLIAGYGLVIYSERWVSHDLENDVFQFGFPLAWKTDYFISCPGDCFGIREAVSTYNFAIDWAFYSAAVYSAILAILVFSRRQKQREDRTTS